MLLTSGWSEKIPRHKHSSLFCRSISLITLTTNVRKRIVSSLTLWRNKLERFVPGNPFRPSLIFAKKAGTLSDLSGEVAIHRSGNSSKRQFIKAAIHRMAFSSKAQTHLIFKTVSKIFLGLLYQKLF